MFGKRLVIKDSQSLNRMHISVNPFAIVSLSLHREQALDGLLAQELVALHDGEGFILERAERRRRLLNPFFGATPDNFTFRQSKHPVASKGFKVRLVTFAIALVSVYQEIAHVDQASRTQNRLGFGELQARPSHPSRKYRGVLIG
jgi:hypothetical protein